MTTFGGDQREAFLQVETHLMPKNGHSAGSGAVGLLCSLCEHFFH